MSRSASFWNIHVAGGGGTSRWVTAAEGLKPWSYSTTKEGKLYPNPEKWHSIPGKNKNYVSAVNGSTLFRSCNIEVYE